VLGCPVRGGTGCNSFALTREAWQLPMRRRDSVLRMVLEQQAKEIISRLPADDGVTLDIRQAIVSGIATGDTEIESVARTLATSARSLQRRLAATGSRYQNSWETCGARPPDDTWKTIRFPSARLVTRWDTRSQRHSIGHSSGGMGKRRRNFDAKEFEEREDRDNRSWEPVRMTKQRDEPKITDKGACATSSGSAATLGMTKK
jgi:hypothetical protein